MVDERILWLAAMMASGTAVLAVPDHPEPARAVTASVAIARAVPDATISLGSKRIVLDRAPDGLFYIHGRVNETRVRFLVDTGATTLILSAPDAARAGLHTDDDAVGGALQTASGRAAMSWARVDTLDVGGTSFAAMPAAVPASGLKVSLLGQSVLSKLGPITLDGDQMVIGADQRD
jgi:aspartyl protease family protein